MTDKLTLHEAMVVVLSEQPNHTASTKFLSDEIYKRGLYYQKSGGKAQDYQMFLRAKNYPQLFELIDRQTIKLKKDV